MKNKILGSNKGILELIELPLTQMESHEIMIETYYSVISIGTEKTIRTTTDMKSILKIALQKSSMIKELGIKKSIKTFNKVLENYQPLGYSSCGKVIAVGKDTVGIEKGDFVVSTGAGKSIHASTIVVPQTYTCKIETPTPENAFSGVMTIGVNGFNQCNVKVGDRIAVIGGGLIGELTAICASFGGCEVDIIDIDPSVLSRLKNKRYSIKSKPDGTYDAIVIATDTDKTFNLAMQHIKYFGTIVITGYGKIDVDRDLLESKQPSIRCVDAYGKGANHPFYELNKGDILADYNCNTAKRNLERSLFIISRSKVPDYKELPISKYKSIDKIMKEKKYSTIVLKWING